MKDLMYPRWNLIVPSFQIRPQDWTPGACMPRGWIFLRMCKLQGTAKEPLRGLHQRFRHEKSSNPSAVAFRGNENFRKLKG